MARGRCRLAKITMRQVTIRFFAHLKDIAGQESLSLPLEKDCSLKLLIAQLEETIPALKGFAAGGCQIAVNQEFVNEQAVIHPGDEIAFLPPFSGG